MSISMLACGLALVAGAVAASAQSSGTATGTLTVNGKETALHYAYAWRDEGSEPEIVVLLSDVAVGVLDVQDPFALHALANAGKLHAIEVRFSPRGEVNSGSLYDAAVGEGRVTRTGMDFFDKKRFDAMHVDGRLYMKEASDLEGQVHRYDASFAAEIAGKPKPTAEGAAAAASEPGKVALAFLHAVLAKDGATLKTIMTPKLVAMFEQSGEGLYQMAAEAYRPTTKIVRLYEYGDKAIAETDRLAPDGQTHAIVKLVRLDGAWKVDF